MKSRQDRRRVALGGKVVVITGASSGIGRAAALAFARCGARLVLAARRTDALDDVVKSCCASGAAAHAVTVDVTSEKDLEHLLDTTLTRWGRVDVWVNNAGTTMFAGLDDGDFAAHRRVIETNLLAPMYATRLLIPVLRRQGAGTLINIGSVLSHVGQSYVPSYVVSKFGLQGLSEAVRTEFADAGQINVCMVLPYATDTPHFQDGGNFVGRRAHALPPVQDPEKVADAIVEVAIRPRRLRYVPRYVGFGVALHWLCPGPTEQLLQHALQAFHLRGRQAPTRGNLFAPMSAQGAVHGRRRPVVSIPAFAAFVLLDLLRMSRDALTRRTADGR